MKDTVSKMSETYYGLKKENAYDHSPSQKVHTLLFATCVTDVTYFTSIYATNPTVHCCYFSSDNQLLIKENKNQREMSVSIYPHCYYFQHSLFLCKSKCPSVIIFYLPDELRLNLHSLSTGNEFYQLLSENVLILSSFLKDILSR